MNAKKCKAIRKVMRELGFDPKEWMENPSWVPETGPNRKERRKEGAYRPQGIQHNLLSPDCGRAIYREQKFNLLHRPAG